MIDGNPWFNIKLALECRKSWNLMAGRPARSIICLKCLTRFEWHTGVPILIGKINSLSTQQFPARTRAWYCLFQCSCSLAIPLTPSKIVLIPAFDLGEMKKSPLLKSRRSCRCTRIVFCSNQYQINGGLAVPIVSSLYTMPSNIELHFYHLGQRREIWHSEPRHKNASHDERLMEEQFHLLALINVTQLYCPGQSTMDHHKDHLDCPRSPSLGNLQIV